MRTPLFRLGFAMFTSVTVVAAVACGGKEGPDPNPPAGSGGPGGAETPSGASGAGGESSGGAAGGDPSGGGATTTTTQLGDGGDLQGAKLGSSVHTTTETKGEGGPKSTHGQSANEPGRTTKDIQAIIVARRDEARACYDKGLAAHPGIEGDLDVKWVIDPQGNVTEASVDTTKSQILEPSVGACVVEVIKKIKFAESKGGYETRAHYPFNFHPKTSSAKDAGK
ncbi:MAG: AgmX/PglI C-terminal domain-containing protein [Labilithrix sp.]|nr:AgmX/PglI C-terminal domain-containing protein [Labilithrix sp.]